MTCYELANLAVGRARLQRAMDTASAAGDSKWCRDNRPALDELEEKIQKAIETLPASVIEEAREITNAPI